jgi:hypothetical protein
LARNRTSFVTSFDSDRQNLFCAGLIGVEIDRPFPSIFQQDTDPARSKPTKTLDRFSAPKAGVTGSNPVGRANLFISSRIRNAISDSLWFVTDMFPFPLSAGNPGLYFRLCRTSIFPTWICAPTGLPFRARRQVPGAYIQFIETKRKDRLRKTE